MLSEEDKRLYDLDVLARTIYGEARGEFNRTDGGLGALMAIANVIVNRTKFPQRFGKSISEICLKPHQFSCWNANDANYQMITSVQLGDNHIFDLCWNVAENIYQGKWPDLTHGSDHYYASWLSYTPAWVKGVKPQACIGQHNIFLNFMLRKGIHDGSTCYCCGCCFSRNDSPDFKMAFKF